MRRPRPPDQLCIAHIKPLSTDISFDGQDLPKMNFIVPFIEFRIGPRTRVAERHQYMFRHVSSPFVSFSGDRGPTTFWSMSRRRFAADLADRGRGGRLPRARR